MNEDANPTPPVEETPQEQTVPAQLAPVEPKHQGLLNDIVAFVTKKCGKASKVDIHAAFPGDQEHQNLVNRLLTGETKIFVPSREGEGKYYFLK